MGRHTEYSEEIAKEVCDRIACGESLVKIAKSEHMPERSTLLLWMLRQPKFADMYTEAKAKQMDVMAEEITEMSDDKDDIYYTDAQGNKRVDMGAIQQKKLATDARKWVMARLAPRKYGAKAVIDNDNVLTIVNALQQ